MKISKLKIILAALVLILVAAAICLYAPPSGDAQRYADLHRAGGSYQRAWTGEPSLPERLTALMHFSSPSNFYRERLANDRQALVASGYLVEITRPVPDLRAKLAKVRTSLSNTLQQTGAYYEARLDHTKNEVHLLCRKEDISMWEKVLKDYQ
jgi:hypothetical protein